MMKVRYYILITFYVYCVVTLFLAIKIKDTLFFLKQPESLSESLGFIFYGFIQMVFILIFIWLLTAYSGYIFKKTIGNK
jgi:hypothetical protein